MAHCRARLREHRLSPLIDQRGGQNDGRYCNPEVDRLIEVQSQERDIDKRRQLVWGIERILSEDVALPIIAHRRAAQCWQPTFKGYIRHENSLFNNWRFEGAWFDR